MPENILPTLIEEEIRSSYIDYAMSVIVGRALPDVRDGLKPVQRRVLYAMRELGLMPNRPFRKSATVVGEVIGKYHPHGDSPVYDTLVRMAQDFSLRYPLIEGQGNFGSIDGDPPAAYRYTEARLSKVAVEMLSDLDEETVDFIPNFDGRLQEPTVLPSKFPNLLANGSSGIAVGMATNIPPHNIKELVDGIKAVIDNPYIIDDELLNYIKGPDFPSGGTIVGRSGIIEAYKTGRGKILVRSKYHFEHPKGKNTRIVFTEIPYQVSKTTIIERIAKLVKEKKLDGVADLRDESDREGIRIVVEVKRGANEEVVLNRLLKHTPLQDTFGVILLALQNGEPKIMSLRQMIDAFINHRVEVVERRTKYRLRKAEERAHILEGFKIAIANIDRVVEIIKSSSDQSEAKSRLMEEFSLSEAQAKAILDMRLGNLTRMDINKIEEEYQKLLKEIERFKSILSSRRLLFEVIKEELDDIKNKFGDERRTKIIDEEPVDISIEDLVPDEPVGITMTYQGYIKRTPIKSYTAQGRGGVGRKGISTYEDDFPWLVTIAKNHDNVLMLSNLGRAYLTKVYHIQEGSLQARGKPIKTFLRLKEDEKIIEIIPFREFDENKYLFMATSRGIVKKVPLKAFENAGRGGIIAIKLLENDTVIGAVITGGNDEIIIAKTNGVGVRIHESDVRPMGRASIGVRGTRIEENTRAISLVRVANGDNLLIVTRKGYGKKLRIDTIRKVRRGGKGVRFTKVDQRTGELVKVSAINGDDDVILITQNGIVLRLKSESINFYSRNARGVRLMRVKERDFIVDAAVIRKTGEE